MIFVETFVVLLKVEEKNSSRNRLNDGDDQAWANDLAGETSKIKQRMNEEKLSSISERRRRRRKQHAEVIKYLSSNQCLNAIFAEN